LKDAGRYSAARRCATPAASQLCGGYLRQNIEGYEDDPNAGKLVKVSSAKQKLFEETIDDLIDCGKKVVVFARFTAEVREICAYIEKKYGRAAFRLIDGSVKGEERGAAVEDFQTDPVVKVFVAQIATAGLGITLTAADTAIYYSYDYSYANYEQSKARIHRIGQKNNCTYVILSGRQKTASTRRHGGSQAQG
jgi:SNF2 family DNA or RNA helicase